MGGEVEPEPFSPGVLTKLTTSPALSALIALSDDGADEPETTLDCIRGRWRLLTNPTFPSLRACLAYVLRDRGNSERR
jgi:hypothetical protein